MVPQLFSRPIYNVLSVIISAILVAGIAIQISALYVFTRKSFREMKLTALFINVAVANIIILIFECPMLLASSIHRRLWPDNDIICNMRGFVCGAASINTIITLQFLVTKTMMLVKNVYPSSFCGETLFRESTLIALSWLYSMLCMLPPLVGWSTIHVDPSGLSCALDWWTQTSDNIAYLIFLTIFAFVLPVSYLAYKLFSLWKYFANKEPSSSEVVNRNRDMYRSVSPPPPNLSENWNKTKQKQKKNYSELNIAKNIGFFVVCLFVFCFLFYFFFFFQ